MHLIRRRPQTSSLEGLRLELLAMASLLDYNGRSSKSIGNYEFIFSCGGLHNAECPVSATFPIATSASSKQTFTKIQVFHQRTGTAWAALVSFVDLSDQSSS